MSKHEDDANGSFWSDLGGIDKLLEHRVRLGICVILSRNDAVNFKRLKQLLEETDGSLGAHLRKLEESKYLRVKKRFEKRRPVTWYILSKTGQNALKGHIDAMDRMIRKNRA